MTNAIDKDILDCRLDTSKDYAMWSDVKYKKGLSNMLSHQIKTLLSEYIKDVCNNETSSIFDTASKIKGASDFSLLITTRLDIMNNLTDFSALEAINTQSTTTYHQLVLDTLVSDIPELEDNLTDNKIVLSEETVFDSVSELDSNTKSKNFVNKKWSRDLIDKIENFSLDHIKSKKKVSRDKLLQEFNNKMLNDIPSEERLVSGNKNAAYIAKFWKNINNRLIKTGKVTLVDEHFVYNEKYLEETV